MSTQDPAAATGDTLADDLERLTRRKQALLESVEFLDQMQQLLDSLDSLVAMGESVAQFPAEIQALLNDLDPKIASLPLPRLRKDLQVLDDLILADIDDIVAAARILCQADSMDAAAASAEMVDAALMMEFRRRTQTSVSLRVLIFRRGHQVPALILPVATSVLEKQVADLDAREQEVRNTLETQVCEMRDDIDLILARPGLPEAIRAQLAGVREQMLGNISHIRAGGRVQDLPVAFESIEMTDDAWGLGAAPAAAPAEVAEPEAPAPDVPAPPERKTVTVAPPVADPAAPPAEPVEIKSRGVLARLWVYFTTPPHVTWEKARTYRRPARKPGK